MQKKPGYVVDAYADGQRKIKGSVLCKEYYAQCNMGSTLINKAA